MPKRINRIRGILKPMLATRSWNDAAHEISSAESKRIIFCRAEGRAAEAEGRAAEAGVVLPKRSVVLPKQSGFRRGDPKKKKKKKAGITVSRRKANCSGLEMTKDRNAEENRGLNPLKWLGNHERSAVSVLKSTIVPQFVKFSQMAYYNKARFSLRAPMFRVFQTIWRPSARAFAPSADVS